MPSELRVDKVSSTTSPYTPVFSTTGGALSHRNMIINGAMQVAQRGTSATSVASAGYKVADRWGLSYNTGGTWTISQSTDAPSGFGYSQKYEVTTAQSTPTRLWIQSSQEGYNVQSIGKGTSDAKQVTLSFWVKASVTGTNIAEIYDVNNTRQISKSYTINTADTWEYKTITFDADTTGTFSNDNGASLRLVLPLASGTSFTSGTLNTSWASVTNANRHVGQTNHAATVGNTFYITGVQLELGSVATPFEHRSYADELVRCQRYFIAYGVDTSGSADRNHDTAFRSTTPSASNTISTNVCFTNVDLPVRLRTGNITFTALAAFNGSGTNLSNTNWRPFVAGSANAQRICIQKHTNSMTTNQSLIGLSFTVSAEL